MTDSKPPHGDQDGPPTGGAEQSDPATQWWQQPTAGGNADPTVLRGGPEQFGYQSTAQPYAAPLTPPPAPLPMTPQPMMMQPPMMQPPGPPGYPPQYGNPFPVTPPPRKRNLTPWIVSGVVVLVVGLLLVIGIAVVVGKASGPKSWEGDYSWDKASNGCNVVDVTILEEWAPTPKETTHTEDSPSDSYGGGSHQCDSTYVGAGVEEATLNVEASFESKYGGTSYDIWKSIDTGTTGTGHGGGELTGNWDEGYFAYEEDDWSSFRTLDYTVAVQDSNIAVQVEIRIYSDSTIDKATVRAACEAQLEKVLAGLRN